MVQVSAGPCERALEIAPSFLTPHMGRAFANAVLGRYDELLEGITYFRFLEDLLKRVEKHIITKAQKLIQFQEFIKNMALFL